MARQPRKRSGSRTPDVTEDRTSPATEGSTRESQPDTTGPGTTGRFLVLLGEDADAGSRNAQPRIGAASCERG